MRNLTWWCRHAGRVGVVAGWIGLLFGSAQAAPGVIQYHGALTYDTGAGFDGTLSQVLVQIWDSSAPNPATETPVWEYEFTSVDVVDGSLGLLLGAGGSPPLTSELFATASSDLWMQFTVNGTAMAPLQRIVSVPYALAAGRAEAIGDYAASELALVTDLDAYAELGALDEYVRRDGTAAMAGDLDLGQHALVNAAVQSDAVAPSNPVTAQLWFDTVSARLQVFDGNQWVAVGAGAGSGARIEHAQDGVAANAHFDVAHGKGTNFLDLTVYGSDLALAIGRSPSLIPAARRDAPTAAPAWREHSRPPRTRRFPGGCANSRAFQYRPESP